MNDNNSVLLLKEKSFKKVAITISIIFGLAIMLILILSFNKPVYADNTWEAGYEYGVMYFFLSLLLGSLVFCFVYLVWFISIKDWLFKEDEL